MKDGVSNSLKLISRQMNVSKNVTKINRQQDQYLFSDFEAPYPVAMRDGERHLVILFVYFW